MPRPNIDITSEKLVYALAAVPVAWVGLKLVREALHALFPSKFPGTTATALVATPTVTDDTSVKPGQVKEYDYIICGGGTAGCVLANRLTEDPNITVLVIEAGESDLKQLLSRIPAGFGQLFESAFDWNIITEPQKHAGNRKLYWPRGKMLGGCSAINAMMYQRGAPDDFNEWENKYGCEGWSYADTVKYHVKAENFTPDPRFPIKSEAEHGHGGPWQVGYRHVHQASLDFLESLDKAGIPKIEDVNTSKGPLGSAVVQTFIDPKGQRSSTSVAYIDAEVASRPNLFIAVGQVVTRVLFEGSNPPRAVGVEMGASSISPIRYTARAKKEVLVTAGAVHSPQLLMCSGIGPAKHLAEFDIPVVKDAPGVGENLQDHQIGALVARTDASKSIQFITDKVKSISSLLRWFYDGTGPMTTNVGEIYAFLKIKDHGGANLPDESSGPTGPDLELLPAPLSYMNHGRTLPTHKDGSISMLAVALRPESRGTIRLASSSIFDQPRVDPNALSTENDVELLAIGCELVYKVMCTPPISEYVLGWDLAPKNIENATREDWRQFVRDTFETLYHPVGTCKMGRADDAMAVLDARLRVRGVEGLRVVDASVMPRIAASHTCAPVVMIAEKAADMIKEDRKAGKA